MTGPRPQHWQLFVDESGSFMTRKGEDWQPGRPPWLVGGILLARPDSPQLHLAISTGIRRSHPGIPYPPHATDLRLEAAHAVAAHRIHAAGGRHSAAAASACRALMADKDPSTRGFREAIDFGEWPTRAELEAATRWLRHPSRRQHFQACRAARNVHSRLVRSMLAALGRCVGPIRVALAAQPDGVGRLGQPTCAYLEVFETLLERLRGALASDRPAVLHIHTAELLLNLEPKRTRMLAASDLEALLLTSGALEQLVASPRSLPPLDVQFGEPEALQEPEGTPQAVNPGLVLADLVCNGLFGFVARNEPWVRVSSAANRSLAMSGAIVPSWASTPLPLLAATGKARDFVLAPPCMASPPSTPGWVSEQAIRWNQHASPAPPPEDET